MRTSNGASREPASIKLWTASQMAALARALVAELDRLRLSAFEQPQDGRRVVSGPLSVDIAGHEAAVDDAPIDLQPREFALLKALALNVGRVMSRDQLLSLAWPDPRCVDSSRTVDVHIRRLRLKLGKAAYLIRTLTGSGYKLIRLEQQADVESKWIN